MEWDFIVVGAGSAGCALAYELVRSGARVLVLESGGNDRSPFIKIPACQMQAIRHHAWNFESQPDPTRNGKNESWTRGRVLGGSSSVNGMMFVRGAPSDFDRWAALGNQGWAYEDVLPIFRDMECSDQLNPLRGRSGPLHVQTVNRAHPLTDAFIQSALARGYPLNPDYNRSSQEGVAYAQVCQKRGLRCSAAKAFLKPLLRWKNVQLMLHATVHRIDVRDGRARAVVFSHESDIRTATARHVILCAGAINSPQLLMLSGIGDRRHLEQHGIQPQVHSPDVGGHLQEHPLISLTYQMRIPSNNLTEGVRQKIALARDYLLHGSGPIANLFEAAAFLRSTPAERDPDIQLHFLSVGFRKAANGAVSLLHFPAVTVYVNKSHPRSRGRIRLASSNPEVAPLIECRLLDDPSDVETLMNGVTAVRQIMSISPMADLVASEMTPGTDCKDRESLRAYIRANTEIAYHPVGTCRMGVDSRAVVSPELRVHGVENLWVADASVMPDLISGNTNATCMMIGLKLGRQLTAHARDVSAENFRARAVAQ